MKQTYFQICSCVKYIQSLGYVINEYDDVGPHESQSTIAYLILHELVAVIVTQVFEQFVPLNSTVMSGFSDDHVMTKRID
jgi:hypothetical protein